MKAHYTYFSDDFWNFLVFQTPNGRILVDFSRYETLCETFRRVGGGAEAEKLVCRLRETEECKTIRAFLEEPGAKFHFLMRPSSVFLFLFLLPDPNAFPDATFVSLKINQHEYAIFKIHGEKSLWSHFGIPDPRQTQQTPLEVEGLYFNTELDHFLKAFKFLTLGQPLKIASGLSGQFAPNGSGFGESGLMVTFMDENYFFVSEFDRPSMQISRNYDFPQPHRVFCLKDDRVFHSPVPENPGTAPPNPAKQEAFWDECWKLRIMEAHTMAPPPPTSYPVVFTSGLRHPLLLLKSDFEVVEFLYFSYLLNYRTKLVIVSENTFYTISFSVNNFEYVNQRLMETVFLPSPFYVLKYDSLVELPGHQDCKDEVALVEYLTKNDAWMHEKFMFVCKEVDRTWIQNALKVVNCDHWVVRLGGNGQEKVHPKLTERAKEVRREVVGQVFGIHKTTFLQTSADGSPVTKGAVAANTQQIFSDQPIKEGAIVEVNLQKSSLKVISDSEEVFIKVLSSSSELGMEGVLAILAADGYVVLDRTETTVRALNSQTLTSVELVLGMSTIDVKTKSVTEIRKIAKAFHKKFGKKKQKPHISG